MPRLDTSHVVSIREVKGGAGPPTSWNDGRGAQRAGLRGVFVRSGKHGDAELARVSGERGGRAPDAVAPSLLEVVDALVG